MRRQRDVHPRPRGDRGGRLGRAELVRQDLALADGECTRALQAGDVATMREHVTLARKFVLEASEKLRRIG